MLTDDKKIGTAEYWDDFYTGKNTGKQDNSNTVRDANPFDRFKIVIDQIEGKYILDVGSGHARIPKMIACNWPHTYVLATEQSPEAKKAANYEPYIITTGYNLPFVDNVTQEQKWDLVMITQALEYMEDQDKFMIEAKRVGNKLLVTVPLGNMSTWSQFRIYTEENFKEFLLKYGEIEVFEVYDSIMLAKIKFHE